MACGSMAQSLSGKALKKQIASNLTLALEQYKLLDKNVPADRMPQNFDIKNGKLTTSNTKWWCAGFFPGTLWYLFEYSKSPEIRKIAE
ncbi:MAG: glucuronyl hydrolase, partial [Chitinophagaceae bacterium]